MLKLVILPIGQVALNVLQVIQRRLSKVFPNAEATVLETIMPIPSDAYNPSRQQYHSACILAKVNNYIRSVEVRCVLCVTEVDLYVPSLNFVFGQAQCPGRVALISLFRLKPEFYGEPANNELFFDRTFKEAVHEIGHTLGLGHCTNPLCIMFFSNSIRDTDRKRAEFCKECRKEVLKAFGVRA